MALAKRLYVAIAIAILIAILIPTVLSLVGAFVMSMNRGVGEEVKLHGHPVPGYVHRLDNVLIYGLAVHSLSRSPPIAPLYPDKKVVILNLGPATTIVTTIGISIALPPLHAMVVEIPTSSYIVLRVPKNVSYVLLLYIPSKEGKKMLISSPLNVSAKPLDLGQTVIRYSRGSARCLDKICLVVDLSKSVPIVYKLSRGAMYRSSGGIVVIGCRG